MVRITDIAGPGAEDVLGDEEVGEASKPTSGSETQSGVRINSDVADQVRGVVADAMPDCDESTQRDVAFRLLKAIRDFAQATNKAAAL